MRANTARWKVARVRSAIVLLALIATTACSTTNPKSYRALSDDWRRSALAEDTAEFGAPVFEGSAFLERGELVRVVLEQNPSVRAARYAWRAALERYPQVTALDDPMLGAGVAPRSIRSSAVNDAPKFDLSQKLPFPGKLRLRGEAALAEAEAASHDFEAVRLRLATMASLLFDDYYLAARSLEINAEHIALLGEFQRIATVRYEAGEASQQDPIQAEVELTHALHREITIETAQRITGEQINALLHRAPTHPLPPVPTRTEVPVDPSDSAELLLERALEDRPERAAAVARVNAERSRVDLARREYFPDFTLTGSYNGLWQEEDLQPFVGVQVNIPLQFGRRKAAVSEARARLERARSQQHEIEDDLRLALQIGVDRLAEARHVELLVRDRLLPAARDQVAAARSGFETGRNSFLALIDAQRNLLDTEFGHEESLANLGRRRAELDRALGRLPGLTW
jgi:outer membrane protein TolC